MAADEPPLPTIIPPTPNPDKCVSFFEQSLYESQGAVMEFQVKILSRQPGFDSRLGRTTENMIKIDHQKSNRNCKRP